MAISDPFSNVLADAPTSAGRETSAIANTRIDWKETPEAHIFKVDLPGLKKEEVKVEVEEGRVLQISGERSREHDEKNEKWHLVERSSGEFVCRFRLPENVKMDHVKVSMEDRVLTVMVPKEEEKKPEYPQTQALLTALEEDDPEADLLVELLNRALSCTDLKEVFDYGHIPDDVMQWALAQTVQVATIQAPAAPNATIHPATLSERVLGWEVSPIPSFVCCRELRHDRGGWWILKMLLVWMVLLFDLADLD